VLKGLGIRKRSQLLRTQARLTEMEMGTMGAGELARLIRPPLTTPRGPCGRPRRGRQGLLRQIVDQRRQASRPPGDEHADRAEVQTAIDGGDQFAVAAFADHDRRFERPEAAA